MKDIPPGMDVVFLLDEEGPYDNVTVTLVWAEVLERYSNLSVLVATPNHPYKKRVQHGHYWEYPEDAVMEYRQRVDAMTKKMNENLAKMRKELA